MYQELVQTENDIKSLEQKKYDILGKIKTGMIIRFPGKDMVQGVTSGISNKQKELLFVIEGTDNKVALVNIGGTYFRHPQLSHAFMPREYVLEMIEKYDGSILSESMQDILQHYSRRK